ncbi:hypothetical protein CLUP02_00398 [Colletotrichum lupini]|uniref:Uncharacterized protein n=1 Tax=Colletotrichum lupini TaxID=145971 RepID=A0A9Q8SA94_9PEZI|nr:hypothetical protein CLUP02_00398 [Colletotrichum lupini]
MGLLSLITLVLPMLVEFAGNQLAT